METESKKINVDETSRDGLSMTIDRRDLFSTSGAEILLILNQDVKKLTEKKYRNRYMEILKTAARQFSMRGYHSATTAHIADELGVQQASLYYYLKSKEQALEQICEIAIAGYVGFSERIRSKPASVSDKLRELIYLHLVTLEERPFFFKVFQDNRKDLPEAARRRIGCQIRVYEDNVESILREGIRDGLLRKDLNAVHARRYLVGLCNSVSIWWGGRSDAPLAGIADEIASIFLDGISAGQS